MTSKSIAPQGQSSQEDGLQVSFVIPARNEQLLIAQTIRTIQQAAADCSISYEIIVANDDSTDATARIAADCGARVRDVKLHNIGAVRNAGAQIAIGELLFFLDADTQLPTATLRAVLAAVEAGAIGGGAAVTFDQRLPWFSSLMVKAFTFYWQRWHRWAAGCCIYVRRDIFEQLGGFDVRYYAAEERYISEAIRARGTFVIVDEPVVTSARKLRLFSLWKLIRIASYAMFVKRWDLQDPQGLEILYDAPRESEATKKA